MALIITSLALAPDGTYSFLLLMVSLWAYCAVAGAGICAKYPADDVCRGMIMACVGGVCVVVVGFVCRQFADLAPVSFGLIYWVHTITLLTWVTLTLGLMFKGIMTEDDEPDMIMVGVFVIITILTVNWMVDGAEFDHHYAGVVVQCPGEQAIGYQGQYAVLSARIAVGARCKLTIVD